VRKERKEGKYEVEMPIYEPNRVKLLYARKHSYKIMYQ